jgi:hypothetical protein
VTQNEPADPPTPPAGIPRVYPEPRRRMDPRPLVLGVIIGLVVGAGGVGLAWGLGAGTGSAADADARAVCGVLARTPDPASYEDLTEEYANRFSISGVATAIAKTDGRYRPLADALDNALNSLRQFDLDAMRQHLRQARDACAQL